MDENIISTSMFMYSEDFLHYHFSATKQGYYKYCPVDLILYEAMLWGKDNNLKRLHLGGGTSNSNEDSLLKFKCGFSKSEKTEFYTGTNIYNVKQYNLFSVLVNNKEDCTYFPKYRYTYKY